MGEIQSAISQRTNFAIGAPLGRPHEECFDQTMRVVEAAIPPKPILWLAPRPPFLRTALTVAWSLSGFQSHRRYATYHSWLQGLFGWTYRARRLLRRSPSRLRFRPLGVLFGQIYWTPCPLQSSKVAEHAVEVEVAVVACLFAYYDCQSSVLDCLLAASYAQQRSG